MNTVQLECFLSVAESLNFARAAEALHITQPAVTHQINSLETELNAKLFHRTTRTVELTAEGWNFIGDARNILMLTHAAKMRAANQSDAEIVPFTIGCQSSIELSLLPDLIRELVNLHPNLHPIIKAVPLQILRNHLEDGAVDVMLGFKERESQRKIGTYLELFKSPSACVVPLSHTLANLNSVTEADLSKEKIILCDLHTNPQAVAGMQHQMAGSRPPSEVYFCERLESVLTLVKAGLGFTILPDIPFMRDHTLRYIPVENGDVTSFGLYYKTSKGNPVLKDFIALAKKNLGAVAVVPR